MTATARGSTMRTRWRRLTARWTELALLLLPLLAVWVGVTDVALVRGASQPGPDELLAAGVLCLSFLALHAVLLWHLPSADQTLLPLVAVLMTISLAMIARVAPSVLPRQALWIGLGALALAVTTRPEFGQENAAESPLGVAARLVAFVSSGFRAPAILEKEIEVNQ